MYKNFLLRTLCFILITFFSITVFAQNDMGEADDDRGVNKLMVYKTYEEYVKNTPSIIAEANLKYIRVSKKDTTIIAAKPKGSENLEGKIWGFSDGQNTFVKFMGSVIGHRFWKLQCGGLNPYVFYKQKTLLATGGGVTALATLAATAVVPSQYTLMVVMKSGKLKAANKGNIKRVLSDSPEYLEELKKASPLSQGEKVRLIKGYSEWK